MSAAEDFSVDLKTSYYEDIQLLPSRSARAAFMTFISLLIIFPFLAANYTIYTVNFLAINVLIAVGMNILVGYTGQVSIGHAGFLAIGAYTTALTSAAHWPLPLALLAGGFCAALFGFVLGLPALKLEGPYLAIATLGFGLAVTQTIGRIPELGGRTGLSVSAPSVFGLRLVGDRELYWLVVGLTFLLTWMARNLMRSRVGRAFQAIRDNETAAQTLGIHLAYFKTLSFAVSAFYIGIAGGLIAFVTGFINPDQFNFLLSILFLAMVVVGGRGAILGSVLGGVLIGAVSLKMDVIPELPLIGPVLFEISERYMTVAGLPNVGLIILGLALIVAVTYEPLGLYGFWLRTKLYWKAWPF